MCTCAITRHGELIVLHLQGYILRTPNYLVFFYVLFCWKFHCERVSHKSKVPRHRNILILWKIKILFLHDIIILVHSEAGVVFMRMIRFMEKFSHLNVVVYVCEWLEFWSSWSCFGCSNCYKLMDVLQIVECIVDHYDLK